jgi:hypothetical protein
MNLFVCLQRAELEMSSEELQAQRRRESLMGRVRERRRQRRIMREHDFSAWLTYPSSVVSFFLSVHAVEVPCGLVVHVVTDEGTDCELPC